MRLLCYDGWCKRGIDMITINNNLLKVSVKLHGAELVSAIEIESGLERMWRGTDDYWAKVSPILFPIVGRVKDNYTFINDERFEMTQHGFLRDQDFSLESLEDSKVTLVYKSLGNHIDVYPFEFEIRVHYILDGYRLEVKWEVKNCSEDEMLYSIGGHPAFAINPEDSYSFELMGSGENHLITIDEGHVDREVLVDLPVNVPVTYDVLKNDAVIYSNIDKVILKNSVNDQRIVVECEGFNYVGLWANTKHGHMPPFVCIEPWYGITDSVTSNHQFKEKSGIRTLLPSQSETLAYTIIYK